MLRLSGLDNFYYLPMLHDMRYKGPRLSEIMCNTYHRDPLNGDIYIYMSRERFQTHCGHHKTYMWCLVNPKANIVIFFYEDTVDKYGNRKSCGRNRVYKREDLYIEKGYNVEKIKEMRNDEYARSIVDKLQNEMYNLMANKMDELPKLMQQALNYLHKFWKQVFAYRNDGEYSIDNLAAERAIRPQTIQRKGSLFFGSVQGALRSAMYNTFIQTCKQVGVSFRQYFKALLKAVKSGRTATRTCFR